MKLQRFSARAVACAALSCLVFASADLLYAGEPEAAPSKPAEARAAPKTPSWFREDQDGVLWFHQGDDGETEYSSSLVLSAVTDGIVITVTANKKYIDDAVGLAKKMRTVLKRGEHMPDDIVVVARQDEVRGAGYRFYTDGFGVSNGEDSSKPLFPPHEAKTLLNRVSKQYRILIEEFVPAGKWGKDHADMKALNIVPFQKPEAHNQRLED